MTDAEKLAVKTKFHEAHNMSASDMEAHFASELSDGASLDPRAAKILKKRSGLSDGKQALALKKKTQWDDADYDTAKNLTNAISRTSAKTTATKTAEGDWTPHGISLLNRGHKPADKIAEADASLRQISEQINSQVRDIIAAVCGCDPTDYDLMPQWYVPDNQIYVSAGYCVADIDGDNYQFNFTITEDAVAVDPNYVDVAVTWTPETDHPNETEPVPEEPAAVIAESFYQEHDVIEVAESGGAKKWLVRLISAGPGSSRTPQGHRVVYSADAIEAACEDGTLDNLPVRNITDEDHRAGKDGNVIAQLGKATYNKIAQSAEAWMEWTNEDAYPAYLERGLKAAIAEGRAHEYPLGLSLIGNVDNINGKVTKFTNAKYCDLVSIAGARGQVVKIAEGGTTQMKLTEKLSAMGVKKIPKSIQGAASIMNISEAAAEGTATAIGFMIDYLDSKGSKPLSDAMKQFYQKNQDDLVTAFALAAGLEDSDPNAGNEPDADNAAGAGAGGDAGGAPTAEAAVIREAQDTILTAAIATHVNGAQLDQIHKDVILKKFTNDVKKNHTYKSEELQTAIQEALDVQTHYKKQPENVQRVGIVKSDYDKAQVMVNDFFFASLKGTHSERSKIAEAYSDTFKISKNTTGQIRSFQMLLETLIPGLDVHNADITSARNQAIAEAMDSALVTKLLTNGINARLAYEYNVSDEYDSWRNLVEIVPHFDYMTKSGMTMGGFTGWGEVAISSDFGALTDSGLASESYTLTRKGGIVTINEVHIRNDNVGYIAKLPERLGKLAKRKESAYVHNLYTSNPTLGTDSVALFHANHSNTIGDALSNASLKTLVGFLQTQSFPNDTDLLATRPKFLVVSLNADDQEMAYGLTKLSFGQYNDVPAWMQQLNVQVVVNPHSLNRSWYLFGDPSQVPTIEMGFLDGNETPIVEMSMLPGVGSWFTAGDAKWKVKQSYAGAALTYRGMAGSLIA